VGRAPSNIKINKTINIVPNILFLLLNSNPTFAGNMTVLVFYLIRYIATNMPENTCGYCEGN